MKRIGAFALLVLFAACSRDEPPAPSSGAPDAANPAPSAAPVQPQTSASESNEVTHELVGTRWALVRLGGEPVSLPDGAQEPFLALESTESRAVGYGGCNRFTGSYALSGDELSFKQMASTRMACPDMQTESAVMKALEATARWQISGAQLDLFSANGALVASFEARNL
jgi:heat shock protein HslJ